MTKLNLPVTHIAAGQSTGFLKYYAVSAVLGFFIVLFASWALT
jgi:hypothetical protein